MRSNQEQSNRHWYALYTRPRHEKKVEQQLQEKEIHTYLPLRQVLRRWSDRKKWVEEPLFRSYIFVLADPQERYRAVQSVGALRWVSFNGKPARVTEEEIGTIQRLLREAPALECADYLCVGDRVEIVQGPLAGLRGILEEDRNGRRFIVRIESIRQALRFSVTPGDLQTR